MAPESPRTRIDQFFASRKKKKCLSPSLKSGRFPKDPKCTLDGSPSAKGSLQGYLVTSQEEHRASGSSAGQDPVKRSLVLEVDLSSKGETKDAVHLNQRFPREEVRNEQVEGPSEGGDVAGSVIGDKCLDHAHGAGNCELKQFAADFLSLYCRELQPSVVSPLEVKTNAHKRHGSPSMLVVEDKVSKRRHCTADAAHFHSEEETHYASAQSHIIADLGEAAFVSSREVIVDNDFAEPKASLRKCNRDSVTGHITGSETPCPLNMKLGARETPKSSRGSSMFSPGEAFWNEAIQVADGLFPRSDHLSFQKNEEIDNEEISESNNIRNVRGLGLKSNELLNENARKVCNGEIKTSMGSEGKHGKGMYKEVSPLPVKHFDFSLEDKNMNEDPPSHYFTGHMEGLNKRDSRQIGCISGKDRSQRTANSACCHDKTHTVGEMQEVHKKATHSFKGKGNSDFINQDNLGMTLDTPDKDFTSKFEWNGDNTPSSSMCAKDRLDLSRWLPPEICNVYKKKGLSKLYPWQVDCLMVDGVLEKKNLVYCASTSAGKSFVAEILMLRRVWSTGKMALLVLPYVSICAEKAEHLEVLLEPLNKHVRSYYGNQGGGTLPKDTSIAVCTIEKANSLINRLLEEGRLSEVGTIVIDELHMVGDQSRGYLLELLLTKLRYAAGEGNVESPSGESSGTSSGKADPANGLQIVGMSATLPNVAAVAEWLQAALYQTEFRPVPLEEFIKVGNTIYNKNMDIVRTIPKVADLGGKDPDHIVEMCNEVVQEGHSVLLFCSSRKGCESTARHVAKFLKKFSASAHSDESEFMDIGAVMDALRRCPAGLDPVLEEAIPSGVAYHHAGLTVEEREIVETCYRKGLIRVLTATSTLAAGVNLPARRVIFRQPRIGRDFIDGTKYRQMAGRAGRTGIDTKGESVLICKPDEIKRITRLLNDSCPPLHSCLSEDKNGMTHAILEVVAGGIVQTATDIHRYVRCTLLNSTKPFEDVVKAAQDSLKWLCHRKFLEWNEDSKLYSTSPLGRASFGSSLCPEESLIVLDDLSRAREGFVLASDLHLVYLVTPINVDVEPDWELYYERFMQLSNLDQSVGNRVGVVEPFLMRMAHGAPINRSKSNTKGLQGRLDHRAGLTNHTLLSDDRTLRVCKRFYVALILSKLVQEIPISEVCEAFKVARGMVQALQENAGRFASMVAVFCERLGWQDLEGLVSKFQNRVSFGVRAEIVELTTIPFVKGSRARALYKAGLRTSQAIAEASVPEIVKALFETTSWASQEGSAQRRMQLGIARKIKNGARKIVLDKAEEARIEAFSALKSLGLDVPQFSRPLVFTGAANATLKEATISSGEDTNESSVGLERRDPVLAITSVDGTVSFDKVTSENDGEKSAGMPTVAPRAVAKANFNGAVQSNFGADRSDGMDYQRNTSVEGKHVDTGPSTSIRATGNENRICVEPLERGNLKQLEIGPAYPDNKENACEKGPVNAANVLGGFDSFLDTWNNTFEFYFDIHFNKRSVDTIAPYEIHGIAICWDNSPVYYVNLPKDLLWTDGGRVNCSSMSNSGDNGESLNPEHLLEIAKQRWSRIVGIMGKKDVRKFTWNLKVQIQVLKYPAISIHRFGSLNHAIRTMGLELIDNTCYMLSPVYVLHGIDLSVAAWTLWPDDEKSSNPNLEKEVKKRLSNEAAAAANRQGRWKNQMRRVAHNGCCRRAAQTRALHTVLWKLLVSEELTEALLSIELPLVNVLADMEIWGIGVDMEGCLRARHVLGRKLRNLEKEAYKLAGMTFSLYTAADIANVLYVHLKLPTPEGSKGKQHPSTDKHCLDLLRHEHPIIPVIKEHRTLAKLLNCTLGSICSLARISMRTQRYLLHGRWLQTSTATGRLSMEEPNLQCVEHTVDFKLIDDGKQGVDLNVDEYKINAREFFVPTQENWLLLTADYSQIELRLMAHFSQDSSLIELLSKPHGDVFNMIASKWIGKAESTVSSQERDQTKRLVYGILYGMGANTLAEQLGCSSEAAAEKIQSFKRSFPGVASWLKDAVTSCRQKGYIQTLKGRKRFLAKIKFGNSTEKSKAQRQAVNSICQGSAADLIKIAMINIHSVTVEEFKKSSYNPALVERFQMLRGRCRILLQVHDELVLEADPSVIREAGLLLQMSMESAASLHVPLHAKLMVGRTWGSLEPFLAEKYEDAIFS